MSKESEGRVTQLDLDRDLIHAVFKADDVISGDSGNLHALDRREREAFRNFEDRLDDGKELSEKQRSWLQSAAKRLGVEEVEPAANVWSAMAPEKRELEKKRASRYAFENMPRPLRPPVRRS